MRVWKNLSMVDNRNTKSFVDLVNDKLKITGDEEIDAILIGFIIFFIFLILNLLL